MHGKAGRQATLIFADMGCVPRCGNNPDSIVFLVCCQGRRAKACWEKSATGRFHNPPYFLPFKSWSGKNLHPTLDKASYCEALFSASVTSSFVPASFDSKMGWFWLAL